MRLDDHILVSKARRLEDLDLPAAALRQDAPGLTAGLELNARLSEVRAETPPAPPRENLLKSVITPAHHAEVTDMEATTFKTHRRNWPLRLAWAGLAVVVLLAAALLLPVSGMFGSNSKAWAVSDGFILRYTLPGDAFDGVPECNHRDASECTCPYFGDAWRAAEAWGKQNGVEFAPPNGREIERTPALVISRSTCQQDNQPTQTRLEILAIGLSEAQISGLQEALAKVPGLENAQVEPASWYYIEAMTTGGLYIEVSGHAFYFPVTTSAEEISRLMTERMRAEEPGFTGTCVITIEETPDGGRTINIEVMP